MPRLVSLALGLVLALQFSTLHAALVVSITPSAQEYLEGDVGQLDVHVSSDSADELDSFLFDLDIAGGAGVEFERPQSEAFLSDSDYVFFERSLNVNLGLPATLVSEGNSKLTMTDVSANPSDGTPFPRLIPDASNPLLLGQFSFRAAGAGQYDVRLNQGTSSFSDVNFATFDFSPASATFSVSAVPEPSGLLGLSSAVALLWMRRRRKL